MTDKFAIHDIYRIFVNNKTTNTKSFIHIGQDVPEHVAYICSHFSKLQGTMIISNTSKFRKAVGDYSKYDIYNWQIGEIDLMDTDPEVRKYSFEKKFDLISISCAEKSLWTLSQINLQHKPMVVIQYDLFIPNNIENIIAYCSCFGLSLIYQSDTNLAFIPL